MDTMYVIAKSLNDVLNNDSMDMSSKKVVGRSWLTIMMNMKINEAIQNGENQHVLDTYNLFFHNLISLYDANPYESPDDGRTTEARDPNVEGKKVKIVENEEEEIQGEICTKKAVKEEEVERVYEDPFEGMSFGKFVIGNTKVNITYSDDPTEDDGCPEHECPFSTCVHCGDEEDNSEKKGDKERSKEEDPEN